MSFRQRTRITSTPDSKSQPMHCGCPSGKPVWKHFQAEKNVALRSRDSSSPSRICCYWMSPPTTLMPSLSPGWSIFWRISKARLWPSHTIDTFSTTPRVGSWSSTEVVESPTKATTPTGWKPKKRDLSKNNARRRRIRKPSRPNWSGYALTPKGVRQKTRLACNVSKTLTRKNFRLVTRLTRSIFPLVRVWETR